MPNREDGLSRDERDAISAELLLKKLRDGLEQRPRMDSIAEEQTKKQAAHISDEALQLAESEVIHGEPEEFGSDELDEARLREIMNMPSADEADESQNEDLLSPETDSEQADFDEQLLPDNDIAEDLSDIDDDSPWYDEKDIHPAEDTYAEHTDELYEYEPQSSEAEQTLVAGDDTDDGFLAQVAQMIEQGEKSELIGLFEEDDSRLVEDSSFDEPELTESEEEMSDEGALYGEDGGREYNGLNGSEMNSTEISLLSLFGNKEELEEVYGKERAEEIIKAGDEFEVAQTPKKKKFYELFPSDYEYTDHSQKEEITEKYTSAFRSASVRFFFGLVFAAILLFIENAKLFGVELPNVLNISIYPTVFAMVDLQLVLLCALMILDKLAAGFASLFKLKPSHESVTSLLLLMSVVYTVTITLSPGVRNAVLYNFPVALAFVFTSLCELMNLKREAMGFNIVSSGHKKYTIRKLTEEQRLEDAKLFEDYVPADSPMFAVTRTGFVDGFFKRINYRLKNRNIPVIILIVLAEMLLSAGFGIFMKADTYTIVTMVYLAGILGLPGTLLICGSHSFYRATKHAFEAESTIIGDGSLEEYSGGSVVFFDDRDIFPSTGVKINSVKVYGENRIDGVIYNAASIFSKIGGPLADVFGLATLEIGHSDNVQILEAEDNGMRCMVDDIGIYIGSNGYMESKDFETPYGESDEAIEKGEGIRLMYIANEEEILAKFYVQYMVDSEYEEIFKQLYKAGMCVGIRTCDPNINDEFVIKKLRLNEDYPVRVVHGKAGREFVRKAERADSGVISARSVKALLRALSACDRIKYVSKIHGVFEIASTVLVIFVIYALSALGKLGVGSAVTALYQLFWLIPIMFVTMFTE